MEDALAPDEIQIVKMRGYYVLILVVMEDALAQCSRKPPRLHKSSLNPCCNGRCTRTQDEATYKASGTSSLNPCCNGRCTRTAKLGLCFV